VTLLDTAGISVHRIMQVLGHRNEGRVKVYCERQTLQQQKQCSEILAAPVASSMALITKSPEQVVDRYSLSCQNNMFTNSNSPKFVDFKNARFENCNFAFTYNTTKKSDD